jgi:hypothetical protein
LLMLSEFLIQVASISSPIVAMSDQRRIRWISSNS